MSLEVRLTPIEIYQGGIVGIARRIDSIRRDLVNKVPDNGSQWQIDIEGALAELAFAKALGLYAGLTINNYGGADVGQYHVRHSPRPDARLIIRPEDKEEAMYALVTGLEGRYIVHGYIHGTRAKQNIYWMAPNNRPGAWFVPQNALTSFQ